MALLMGFPPSNTISPSVRITEIDLSFIAPISTFHRAGLIGFASKGPINIPTMIQTSRQLNITFGYPHPEVGDPYLIYAGLQYLLIANELFVVRVADTDLVDDEAAAYATVQLPAAGDQVQIISGTPGPYTFCQDSFFRWRLNGVLASKTLVVLSDENRPDPNALLPYSAADLVADLNNQLDFVQDGIQFFVSGAGEIGVETTFAYGPNSSIELVSVQNAMYGGAVGCDPITGIGNPTGLGTGMTQAATTGSNDQYGNGSVSIPGNYNFTGLVGLNLHIVTDGTDNVNIDNVLQVIDLSGLEGDATLTIAEIVTAINNQLAANGGTLPGGWTAYANGNSLQFRTNHSGEDARVLIKSDSTAFDIFGFDGFTAIGVSPSGVTGDPGNYVDGIVVGSPNLTGLVSLTVTADSQGIDGNNTQVVVTNDVQTGTFQMAVFNGGVQVEAWGNLTKDQNSSYYVGTYLTLVSDYIRVNDNTLIGAPPASGTYTLTGGSDGIPSDPDAQDTLLIGSPIAFTGVYTLSEPEQIDIDLVAVPGHTSTNVVLALIDLCENYRGDCLAIIDPPFGLTVQEIIQWQNGTHPLNTVRFDTDFAALYWPWLNIFDSYNQVNVWVPPSGSVMATIANSDNLSEPWFAPAGVNRGVVPGIVDVFSRPTLAERDLMYGNQNAINPIVAFADLDGFMIWGQKTLQRNPTALDRVNVRRLMFVAEKEIRVAARTLLFDPNDDVFQAKFTSLCTGILTQIQIGRGLTAFIILDDATLNTPDVIDRNEFHAQIGIQPTYAAEFIFIEFSVNKTGDFTLPANNF